MAGARKDTSALNGTLNAPPAYGGSGAPIESEYGSAPTVVRSMSSKSAKATSTASEASYQVLHLAAAFVVGMMLLLWIFGGIVFKNANI